MQINREELFQIIDFYKSFKEYSKFSRMELFSHILPAFNFNQYKIYYDNDKIIGYCSWCFLDDLTQKAFKKTGELNSKKWKSGNNFWVYDFLCKGDVKSMANDVKKICKECSGVGVKMKWLRIKNNELVMSKSFLTQSRW